MKSHIGKTASACFFPSEKTTTTVRCSDWWNHETFSNVTGTILDYRNSILYGLPASSLAPLQRLQNVAARFVLKLDHQTHTSSLCYRVFTGCLWRHVLSSRSPLWCTPFFINAAQHIWVTLWNVTLEILVSDSCVLLEPMQLLSWGFRPSSESTPSFSAVRKSGTRYLHTSETLNQFQLFAKLSRFICSPVYDIAMHCQSNYL